MSEPWSPEPAPPLWTDERRLPWWCVFGDSILQDTRPHGNGVIGFCPRHDWQTGVQHDPDSQVTEKLPEEEPDEYDDEE